MDVLTKCRAHPPPRRWSWLQRKNRETKMSQWFQLLHIIHHSSRSSLHMSVCDHDSRHSPFHWDEMYVETSTRSNHRVGNCNLSLRRASWVRWWTGAGESCTLPMKLKVDLLLVSPTWRRKENHAKTWNTCFFSTYFPFQCSKSRAVRSMADLRWLKEVSLALAWCPCGGASGVFSALRPATQWDLKPCFRQTASPAASSSRCVPTRVLLGDYDACSKACHGMGVRKPGSFIPQLNHTQLIGFCESTIQTLIHPANKSHGCSMIFMHRCHQHTSSICLEPSPGIVLAWLTVPWASARNSRSAHRTKRPKYFCPAADGTSARLSASMASKKSWASRSLLPWIPLQWIIDRGDSEKLWPEWVFEFTAGAWAKGMRKRSAIIRKWEPFDGPGAGCRENSELTWLNNILEKKSDGWPKVLDSKEWRTPIKHHVQCTIYVLIRWKSLYRSLFFIEQSVYVHTWSRSTAA